MKPRILGIAASLRNSRWGASNHELIMRLQAISDSEDLFTYLARESQLHKDTFIEPQVGDSNEFNLEYRAFQLRQGGKGLSNTEVALAAALWAANKDGAQIEHVSLSEFFSASQQSRNLNELKERLLSCDGLLISGPVYFGDRGSLVESLFDFIKRDKELHTSLSNKVYGGIAVGAKRNGGQETSLVYQMMDIMALGALAVGNDSNSTAQYGGTGCAGDVGAMHNDTYGLETAMGVGRRISRISRFLTSNARLKDKPKTLFLILQDNDSSALQLAEYLALHLARFSRTSVINISQSKIKRCIACDICPTHIGRDNEYRCIIDSKNDSLSAIHVDLLDHDLLVPIVVTDAQSSTANYQKFIERTRYLRRSDYIWSDLLVAPLIMMDTTSAISTLPMRVVTSFIRHHTIMSHPMIASTQDGKVIDRDQISKVLLSRFSLAERISAGRLEFSSDASIPRYHPFGYVLANKKDKENDSLQKRIDVNNSRRSRISQTARMRLIPPLHNN